MEFSINRSLEILRRTPDVLSSLLQGLSPEWTSENEGEGTWSAYDVVGHLIHGEMTDWIPRMKIICSDAGNKVFEPFDRFAQFATSAGKDLDTLLIEFRSLRAQCIAELVKQELTDDQLHATAMHPALGKVTLRQLLATWAVHDLNHIAQISRVMAKQYQSHVGPWSAYLGILQK